jgi:homoserine kinase
VDGALTFFLISGVSDSPVLSFQRKLESESLSIGLGVTRPVGLGTGGSAAAAAAAGAAGEPKSPP